MKKKYIILAIATSCYFFSETIVANLTTMQHWDPSPIYSANNSLMPPNSNTLHLRKARKKSMNPDHNKFFSMNISGIVQGACRARDCSGCTEFHSDCSAPPSLEHELGNFRGTPYAMGLFLGYDPKGNSIWQNGIDTANIDDLTEASINKTQLPSCLKHVAKVFAGVTDPFTGETFTGANKQNSALMFNPFKIDSTIPSIFSERKLDDDKTYFGAYSLPLEYKKYGLRLEMTADFSENFGLTVQTGFVNIKQQTTGLKSISSCPCTTSTTTNTDSFGNATTSTTTTDSNTLYAQLNVRSDLNAPPNVPQQPNTEVQSIYDRFISNNHDRLLSADCGINQIVCNFDEYSIEDVRFLLSFKHTYGLDHYTKGEEHPENWAEMLFTPYLWVGGSFPAGKNQDYTQLLSLPFGNNGHGSLGGGIGMMFDFKETIEVGFEGGGTYFFSNEETRPMPNHKLQRVIYPYHTRVISEPGANWHFKAHMNAYQFMKHASFWATYEFIVHRRDNYRICDTNVVQGRQIFYPEVIECCSEWRAQFLNMGLTFDIQPGMQAGLVWQQPITPRNAYYPVSIIGTFSFMF